MVSLVATSWFCDSHFKFQIVVAQLNTTRCPGTVSPILTPLRGNVLLQCQVLTMLGGRPSCVCRDLGELYVKAPVCESWQVTSQHCAVLPIPVSTGYELERLSTLNTTVSACTIPLPQRLR